MGMVQVDERTRVLASRREMPMKCLPKLLRSVYYGKVFMKELRRT